MKRLGIVAALIASAVAVGSTASAATTTTYHGIFSGAVVYEGCTTAPPTAMASGTWNVALHGTAVASVTVNILVDGKHHVSFGYGKFEQVPPAAGETFAVAIRTEAGPLRVTLTGGTFAYRIAPYHLFGLDCQSVTYNGTLTS
jgi:hypothetical protein